MFCFHHGYFKWVWDVYGSQGTNISSNRFRSMNIWLHANIWYFVILLTVSDIIRHTLAAIDIPATSTKSIHCSDVIMGVLVYQITSLTIVYWSVYSDADQINLQSTASLAFAWWIPPQMASNAENVDDQSWGPMCGHLGTPSEHIYDSYYNHSSFCIIVYLTFCQI